MVFVNIDDKRKPLTPNAPARRARGYSSVAKALRNDKGPPTLVTTSIEYWPRTKWAIGGSLILGF
jgi:hypothetical protein